MNGFVALFVGCGNMVDGYIGWLNDNRSNLWAQFKRDTVGENVTEYNSDVEFEDYCKAEYVDYLREVKK